MKIYLQAHDLYKLQVFDIEEHAYNFKKVRFKII